MTLSLIERTRTVLLILAAAVLTYAVGCAVNSWLMTTARASTPQHSSGPASPDQVVRRTDAIPAVQAPQRAQAHACALLGNGMNPTWAVGALAGQGWTQGEAESMVADAEDGTSCPHD